MSSSSGSTSEAPAVPWLLRDDRVLASLEIASSRAERRRGLLGRDGIDGALLIERARSVHTFGMAFAIDVAHLDADGRVLRTTHMAPGRLGRWVRGGADVIEAEAGAFANWRLDVGDVLRVERGSGS